MNSLLGVQLYIIVLHWGVLVEALILYTVTLVNRIDHKQSVPADHDGASKSTLDTALQRPESECSLH